MNEMPENKLAGINIHNSPVKVEHAELKRTGGSMFRSVCPACEKGVVMVRRDTDTLKLEAEDICILCGQQYVYTDIDELRKKAGEV